MKNFLIILCLLGNGFFLVAQSKQKMTAYIQTKQFFAPEAGNYVELQIQFVGYTLEYKGVDGGLIGEVGCRVEIHQQDSVVRSNAFRFATPLMQDSIIDDFYDVQRFALEPGEYVVVLHLYDMFNQDAEPISTKFSLQVDDLNNSLAISEMMVAASAYSSKIDTTNPFWRSNYVIIPNIATFYPKELVNLPVYFEIYNSPQMEGDKFGVKQSLINLETGAEVENYSKHTMHETATVVPIFKNIDISKLPTGSYKLSYTLIDKQLHELSTQSYSFDRSNDLELSFDPSETVLDMRFQETITDDSLNYYIASLIPISGTLQERTLLSYLKRKSTHTDEQKRRLIQNFWKETAEVNAFDEWMKYKKQVQWVEHRFATNIKGGFETDRGRVYLQYGPPSRTVERVNSASEYPYQIWQYNKIKVYSNKKFVFYNPDLVNNEYRLLHSDMVGELRNPSWRYELSKRTTAPGDADNPGRNRIDTWGDNSDEMFD